MYDSAEFRELLDAFTQGTSDIEEAKANITT
jgi:predicted RNase H-like HicB family nuclease